MPVTIQLSSPIFNNVRSKFVAEEWTEALTLINASPTLQTTLLKWEAKYIAGTASAILLDSAPEGGRYLKNFQGSGIDVLKLGPGNFLSPTHRALAA